MSSDLLPESVNSFLDDYETSLCLPILVVMVLCTAQFVFNHMFGIGYVIYQNVKKPKKTQDEARGAKTDMMKKLKGVKSAPLYSAKLCFAAIRSLHYCDCIIKMLQRI